VAVAGQQHGMMVLDENGAVIRPALLWNDLRSVAAAAALTAEMGGPGWWASRTGSVPAASFTVTKLRWLAEHEPDHAVRTRAVLLPRDRRAPRLDPPHGHAPEPGPGGGVQSAESRELYGVTIRHSNWSLTSF
jgi:xylulokinase